MRESWLVLGFLVSLLVASATPARAEPDLDALVAALGSPEHTTRYPAYLALRNVKDPRLVSKLENALPGMAAEARPYAFYLLDGLPVDDVRPAMRSLVRAKDAYIRLAAAVWLVRQGDGRRAEVIDDALHAPGLDEPTLLRMLSRLYVVQDDAVTASVRGLLAPDTSLSVLASALGLLGQRRDEGSIPRCRTLLASDAVDVRALAAAFLLQMGEPDTGATLASALETGVSLVVWYRIEQMLGQAAQVPPVVLDAIGGRLDEEQNAAVLARMIGLLARFRHRASLDAIRSFLDHENDLVARAAFDALGAFGGGLPEDRLHALLGHASVKRRLWAADLLRRRDDLAGMDVALAALSDGDATVRAEAAQVIGGFRDDDVVGPLIDRLLDDDPSVRSAAVLALGNVLRSLFPYRRIDVSRTGYDAQATAPVRAAAVKQLRAWWAKRRASGW